MTAIQMLFLADLMVDRIESISVVLPVVQNFGGEDYVMNKIYNRCKFIDT